MLFYYQFPNSVKSKKKIIGSETIYQSNLEPSPF